MRAIVQHRYGSPDVLALAEIDRPEPASDEVLVRVRAASVNPYDWHQLTGTPYVIRLQAGLTKPKSVVLGVDLAGTVEAVGAGVTQFRPGDDVYGMRSGAFAEFVCARESRLAPKPHSLTFEQAAAVPMAGVTALQGLRKGKIGARMAVLINGASGGVGTLAVQITKAHGATVTGVCSAANAELVQSAGADDVVDYTREDFTERGQRYDLILDLAGSRPLSACKRALSADGTMVIIGGSKTGRWLGPITFSLKAVAASKIGGMKVQAMLAQSSQDDLVELTRLIEAGKVAPIIDRIYPLEEVPQALAHVGTGHARGKVVVTV